MKGARTRLSFGPVTPPLERTSRITATSSERRSRQVRNARCNRRHPPDRSTTEPDPTASTPTPPRQNSRHQRAVPLTRRATTIPQATAPTGAVLSCNRFAAMGDRAPHNAIALITASAVTMAAR